MTNSEKQTKNMAKGKRRDNAIPKAQVVTDGDAAGGKNISEAADAKSTDAKSTDAKSTNAGIAADGNAIWQLGFLALLVMGMVFSLQINSWHFTVPVVVLWLGWAGVLATVALIWKAGLSIATEGVGDRMAPLDVSEARRHELNAEKKSLIQAIKEIEFDRDLGKMSDEDATEMMKFYRGRAIEVIKELDGQLDEELSVDERVKRDLEARMAVAVQSRKRPVKSAAVKKKPAPTNSKSQASDPDEETEKSVDSDVKESA